MPVDPDVAEPRARHVLHPRQWDILVVVAVGGAIGSLARWALSEAIVSGPGELPWATLIENASGSALLGLLMVFVVSVWRPSRYVRPFLGVGVLGGYTTFSSYALQTRDLFASGDAPVALAYLLGSVALGVVSVLAGVGVGRLVATAVHRRRARLEHPHSGGPR